MLKVPTIVKESEIHGIGVFLAKDVKLGELVWKFDPRCDFRRADFPEWLSAFVFSDKMGMALDGDNARFMNHSADPNLSDNGRYDALFAVRDIPLGEELTVDYTSEHSKCALTPTVG